MFKRMLHFWGECADDATGGRGRRGTLQSTYFPHHKSGSGRDADVGRRWSVFRHICERPSSAELS